MIPIFTTVAALTVTCLTATADATDEVLPYHQLMTPKWLAKHATIHGSYTYKPNYLEILAGISNQHVLQVKLVPSGVLTNDDSKCVTVTMVIAMDTVWADANDHDPSFGISDGERFTGFHVPDNRGTNPCFKVEGDNVNNVFTNVVHDSSGAKLSNPLRGYSSEVKIQTKPCEKWGSCHTEHEGGFVFIANYQRNLDLNKGLYLDVYRGSAGETYRIEYIAVAVESD
ncbi:uncharacterized protein [Dysidea avara]|uniref:uncharacterized protein n=1 Tax=Dysidea avara TaxID=196820 RepID=UPI003317DD3D